MMTGPLTIEFTIEHFKASMVKAIDLITEVPLVCAFYLDEDQERFYLSTTSAVRALVARNEDGATVKIEVKQIDVDVEAELRGAFFWSCGSGSEVRKRRSEANGKGNGSLEGAVEAKSAHREHAALLKFKGLNAECPYRRSWFVAMRLTPEGRKFLDRTSPQIMQQYLRGRAKIQVALKAHLVKAGEYRRVVNGYHKITFEGQGTFKGCIIALCKKKIMASLSNLNVSLMVLADVYLETLKSMADPEYVDVLCRFRIIFGLIAKFYNQAIFEYSVMLVQAQESMADFRRSNPGYDADEDEDDELEEEIKIYKFDTPASIPNPLDSDMQWPPCDTERQAE
jgi:hypothetical protein